MFRKLVREIYDEIDPDLAALASEPDGTFGQAGRFPTDDLVDVGVDLPIGECATDMSDLADADHLLKGLENP